MRFVTALLWLVLFTLGAAAAEKAQLHATTENGYGRLVLDFTGRLDLPKYKIAFDNGVLAVTFDEPLTLPLPDVASTMPTFFSIARMDPDNKGIRFGMRQAVSVHSMEAGERLFIDLLPSSWQGLPPSLPPEIVAALADRAAKAAAIAEQKRKEELARQLNPTAEVHVGRNPTFMRVEFDWNVDTKASFVQDGTKATLSFDWPVEVDLYPLKADLPSQIVSATSSATNAGSKVVLVLADGVTPRFYGDQGRQFTLDIDLAPAEITANEVTAEELAKQAEAAKQEAAARQLADTKTAADAVPADGPMVSDFVPGEAITPKVDEVGGTIRVTFPFERDTASAAFRRGDTLWMLFDTPTAINEPEKSRALSSIANGFSVVPAGDTQIVRIDLSTEGLTTLASEGRAWVLSVGDVLLNATEPVVLERRRDRDGHFEMTAMLGKPFKVHSFRDPDVGDLLDVVTAFPPARGSVRDRSFVDFDSLRSVHGLVLRPDNVDLDVTVADNSAVIRAPDGLTLSDEAVLKKLDAGNAPEVRDSFVDFAALKEDNPAAFTKKVDELSSDASSKEGQARDVARLALAQYYVGNRFAEEAIGVLKVLDSELKSMDLRKKIRLTTAIADVLAQRPKEALDILNAQVFSDEVDAVMWRSIARVDNNDFVDARSDALASESVIDSYPVWVQQKFLLSSVRAALETQDAPMAQRLLNKVEYAQLADDDVSLYQLLQARLAEAEGRSQEAIDGYGQVIAADVRPTRAEAVYRTLLLLKEEGKIDLAKATQTLSAESMLWRGNTLEVDMEKLLAELYFDNKEFRLGFETTKETARQSPDSPPVNALVDEAGKRFADLYLNGAADQLSDLDALSLFYDYRQLTPPGTRGDEMIRNLARRLVKVDLLPQAADLLQYQIENRLTGVAQAQVAADLALIRIADRDPQAALRVLNSTRTTNLSPSLDRERRILEARALIDADRNELALDLLSRLEGRDADLLRVDGYWKAKNYTAAADLIERMYTAEGTEQLSQPARMNIIRAAVGHVLANDMIGLSRLREKFSGRLAQSAEWPMFDYLTSPNVSVDGLAFKQAAKVVAGIDTVSAFLSSYRQLFPVDPGIVPATATKTNAV